MADDGSTSGRGQCERPWLWRGGGRKLGQPTVDCPLRWPMFFVGEGRWRHGHETACSCQIGAVTALCEQNSRPSGCVAPSGGGGRVYSISAPHNPLRTVLLGHSPTAFKHDLKKASHLFAVEQWLRPSTDAVTWHQTENTSLPYLLYLTAIVHGSVRHFRPGNSSPGQFPVQFPSLTRIFPQLLKRKSEIYIVDRRVVVVKGGMSYIK